MKEALAAGRVSVGEGKTGHGRHVTRRRDASVCAYLLPHLFITTTKPTLHRLQPKNACECTSSRGQVYSTSAET
jgi:hypothetical protein